MVGGRLKAIDSNLLVYASLANHPAMTACEQYITGYQVWVTSIVNLVELQRVLVAVYGVSENDTEKKFADLLQALVVDDLTAGVAAAALHLRRSHGIDFNDAVLLESSRQRGVTVLATDDSQLAIACASMGINRRESGYAGGASANDFLGKSNPSRKGTAPHTACAFIDGSSNMTRHWLPIFIRRRRHYRASFDVALGDCHLRKDAAMGQDGHACMASAETSRNSFSVAPLAD